MQVKVSFWNWIMGRWHYWTLVILFALFSFIGNIIKNSWRGAAYQFEYLGSIFFIGIIFFGFFYWIYYMVKVK